MPKPPSRSPEAQQPEAPAPSREPHSRDVLSPSAAETAGYIAEMAAELCILARQSRLDLLAYLLDMAQLEAANASGRAKTLSRHR